MDEENIENAPRLRPSVPLAALGGGLAIGLTSLLIPNHLIENAVSAYGIAELLPAAAPPLGVTARLLIALGSGLFTASCLYILLSYKGSSKMAFAIARPSLLEKGGISNLLRSLRFGKHAAKDGEIADFDDLPKLRMGDSHPDAPARRPIFAEKDFGEPLTLGLGDELVDDDDSAMHRRWAASRDDIDTVGKADTSKDAFLEDPYPGDLETQNRNVTGPASSTDEAVATPARDARITPSAEPAIADEPVPSFVTAQTDELRSFGTAMDDRNFYATGANIFETPITKLSISELMERLERGLQSRLETARDNITEDGAAEHPGEHTADADTDDSAPIQNRNNVHAMAGTVNESPDYNPGPFVHPLERREAGEQKVTLGAASQDAAITEADIAQEVPENDLDDALKAALETLRIMTDRQKNAH